VRIYTLDHPPPQVYVWKAGAVVKIDLTTHEAVEIAGAISDRDVRRAERLVARNAARLEREWTKIHSYE
jgi:pterin-4a-carbinolamine dehydratase